MVLGEYVDTGNASDLRLDPGLDPENSPTPEYSYKFLYSEGFTFFMSSVLFLFSTCRLETKFEAKKKEGKKRKPKIPKKYIHRHQ